MWGGAVNEIDFQNIYYYLKPARSRKVLGRGPRIKKTFDRLAFRGEQKFSPAWARSRLETVYHKIKESLSEKGVISSIRARPQRAPELFRQYFEPDSASDNKFAALNSAVWSGAPSSTSEGREGRLPSKRISVSTQGMGQFERTLIIVDEGASVITSRAARPHYASDSLHSASWRSS